MQTNSNQLLNQSFPISPLLFTELNKFNNIQYKDSDHSYLIDNKEAISGTRFLHAFVNFFDSLQISLMSSEKKNIEQEELIKEWAATNAISTVKGSLIHEYIELHYQKRVLELDHKIDDVKKNIHFTVNDLMKKNFFSFKNDDERQKYEDEILKTVVSDFESSLPEVKKFLIDTKDILVPIASELIIGDSEFLICGTIDQLFYNLRTEQYEIWDWKTNKEIETVESKQNKGEERYIKYCKSPIEEVPDLNFYHYSLQLSLYKFILEKNTNIKIGALRLKHFNKEGTGQYYLCNYLHDQIVKMTNLHKISLHQTSSLETKYDV